MCHLPLNVTLNTNLGTVRDKMGSFQPLEEFLQPFGLWPCCHLGTSGISVQIILRGWGAVLCTAWCLAAFPGIEPRSPALQVDSLPAEPQGKPMTTGMVSLSLLQQIFLIQEVNWGSCITGRFFTNWAIREALLFSTYYEKCLCCCCC